MNKKITTLLVGLLSFITVMPVMSSDFSGDFKIGYRFVDEEGSLAVYQPTHNLYDGVALSLESFEYRFDDGVRVYGNIRDITLSNRDVRIGLSKAGKFGATLTHKKYRRTYSFSGDQKTRRYRTYGSAWFQAHEYIKLFAGVGVTKKNGAMPALVGSNGVGALENIDYSQTFLNGGVEFRHDRRMVRLEYRAADFDDALNDSLDRTNSRIRATASG
ncbi:MAG: hypothetical protein V3T31_10350, partial [candidate division Zixibacteria bacterium]